MPFETFCWFESVASSSVDRADGVQDTERGRICRGKWQLSQTTHPGKDRCWIDLFFQKGSNQPFNPHVYDRGSIITCPIYQWKTKLRMPQGRIACGVLTLNNPEAPLVQIELHVIKTNQKKKCHILFPKIPRKLFNKPRQLFPII